ncbi:hypothetical protein ERJ75_000348800 [Trypanosoma vivax]|uniref:EIPR1-like beta-propeller domain-containing protein n=1 Tax=Trypanosoma vivax (strain Y486) TaxID=1055687 RepID=G0TVE2_TRYVY|nr:hypothetical protein TRVL_00872 [Trypanosoma vivax]KAH8617605.1 hypothetical protein ERJ75_000348800 [Trypanosoma vivax]CCC47908.1 conserved hypothetical protein [Trypanosoma vivax Y486]
MYGLGLQARAISPLCRPSNGSGVCHNFVVGSCCFSGANKIQLLTYHADTRLFECSATWAHEEEVCGIWGSPALAGPSLLGVSSPSCCRVFRVPDILAEELQVVAEFNLKGAQILWDLNGPQNEVRVVAGNTLQVCSLSGDKIGSVIRALSVDGCTKVNSAAIDPHQPSVCLVVGEGVGLVVFDLRIKNPVSIPGTAALHGMGPTCAVDFSCTTTNRFLTAGGDGCVHFRDLRVDGSAYSVLMQNHIRAHEHCVLKALFNPSDDSLFISSSSDNTLRLWDFSGVTHEKEKPMCVKRLADFSDSVMDACWSSGSPWVFAGVSFNGKVLVDEAPGRCSRDS